MNRKKILFILLILILIISSSDAIAQQASSSSTTDPSELPEERNEERSKIEYKINQVQLESAPKWVIDKINNYIISMVDKDYFTKYLNLMGSQTKVKLDKVGAKYILTYIYTHNLKDSPKSTPYQVEHQFTLRVDSNGNLLAYRGIKYRGPNKPYQFLISKDKANQIAKKYGLEEPFEVSLYYGNQGYNSDIPLKEGTYVWGAGAQKCVTKGNIESLFIDVDSGRIIGKKTSDTSCIERILTFPDEKGKIKDEVKQYKSFFQKIIDWIKSLFIK